MADALIEIADAEGRKVTVSRAHWNRYPQLAESYHPVKAKPKPKPRAKSKPKPPVVAAPVEPEPSE